MMKANKIWVSLYAGFCVYSLLLFYYGASGIDTMKRFENYRIQLLEKIAHIEKTNAELENRLMILGTDTESVQLRSRALGYYDISDNIIKLGNSDLSGSPYTLEHGITRIISADENSSQFRVAGISASLIVFIILLLFVKDESVSLKKGERRFGPDISMQR